MIKMAKNSVFAVLLRSPWWISFAVVGVITLASNALLPPQYVPFGVLGSFPFVVVGLMAAWRQRNAPSKASVAAALERAASMSWRDFADVLESSLAAQGHSVTRLSQTGADFSLTKAGRTTLVSCKRWKAANPGIEGVRELLSAQTKLGADACTIISLGMGSDGAVQLAQKNGVDWIFGDRLGQLLLAKR